MAALGVLCLACLPAWSQDVSAVVGPWQGVILYAPAELEVEIGVELSRNPEGGLSGSIDIPTKPIDGEPLSDIFFEGNLISWELHRPSGTFLFDGALAADGNEIRGRYFERGETYEFSLKRGALAAPAVHPPIHTLSVTGEELKERFNGDVGRVRLVMLLSPG